MYKITVNGTGFQVQQDGSDFSIDGKPFDADLLEFKKGQFHILHHNKSFQAEIIARNEADKTFTIRVNNHTYNVSVQDKYDALLREMGLDTTAFAKAADIKAPMPGLVLNVLVEPGQTISKGDPLIILEAMKMENILKAANDGIISKVFVSVGDKVEKNQVMIGMR